MFIYIPLYFLKKQRNYNLHGVKIIALCPGFTGSYYEKITNQNETIHDNVENIEELDNFHKQLIMQK